MTGGRSQTGGLRYAVRGRVLLRHLGQLAMILGVLIAVPALVAAMLGDEAAAWRYAAPSAILLPAGWLLSRVRWAGQIQANEAMVLAALIFLIAPLAMLPGLAQAGLSPADALFEAISGVTTTGLTTVTSIDGMPISFRLARAWLQWFGGLGIVVLCVALVAHPGLLARGLSATQLEELDFIGGAKRHAQRVLAVYATLTVLGILALVATGTDAVDATCFALSSVSTGGFSPRDGSLAALGHWIPRVIVLLLCLLCASPALLHRPLGRARWRDLLDVQTCGIVALAATCSLVLLVLFRFQQERGWMEALHDASMLGFSAQTTAGFAPGDTSGLDSASMLVLIVAMLTGGGLGSSAGGVKMVRVLILLTVVRTSLLRIGSARHALAMPRLGGVRVSDAEIRAASTVVALFLAVIGLSWFAFLASGYDPMDSLFEVVSATGTVGLSSGVSGTDLPLELKAVLMLDMLLGRLEVVALLVLIAPSTWIGRRVND